MFLRMLIALAMGIFAMFLGPPELALSALIRGIKGISFFAGPVTRRGRVLGFLSVIPGMLLIIPTFALNLILRHAHQAHFNVISIVPDVPKIMLAWLKARADLIGLALGIQHLFTNTCDITGPLGSGGKPVQTDEGKALNLSNIRSHAPISGLRFAAS